MPDKILKHSKQHHKWLGN